MENDTILHLLSWQYNLQFLEMVRIIISLNGASINCEVFSSREVTDKRYGVFERAEDLNRNMHFLNIFFVLYDLA